MPEEKIETPFHFIQTPFRQHLDFMQKNRQVFCLAFSLA